MTPMPEENDRMNQIAFETTAIQRAVDALEAIAEHMGVLATMALANAQPAPAVAAPEGEAPAKRKPGRPRKYLAEPVHVVGAAPAAEPVKAEPTEAERAKQFGKLKAALKECLALHGEEAARARLQHAKFSVVPFDEIEETIARLAA